MTESLDGKFLVIDEFEENMGQKAMAKRWHLGASWKILLRFLLHQIFNNRILFSQALWARESLYTVI